MFLQRLLVAVILVPIGIVLIYLGGIPYLAAILVLLTAASLEFVQMFYAGGHHPAGVFVVGGVLALVLWRAWMGFQNVDALISALVLASLVYHLVDYERGRCNAGTDFGATIAGVFYLGWIGAYFISVRSLPDGQWWVLLILPTAWFADMGAYTIGKIFGRKPLSPRLSPKKTWEGYLGGIVIGILGGVGLGALFQSMRLAGGSITWREGLVLGIVLSVLVTLGDLGESMFKRQMGLKDSGTLFPGHGGAFDRIDSWLWAAVIGYYMVTWLFR